MNVNIKILFLLFSLIFWIPLSAQNTGEQASGFSKSGTLYGHDSIQEKQYHSIQGLYDSVLNVSSNVILNGREYLVYFSPHVSTPIIPVKRYPTSSIIIQGKTYRNLMLQYDTFKDQVIYYDPDNLENNAIIPISVNRTIIDEFDLEYPGNKIKFKYLVIPDTLKGNVNNGFYEIVYDKTSRFVIKHRSILVIKGGRDIYKYKPRRYIVNKGMYYPINGRRSLIKALSDKSVEMKKFIKSSKIFVRWAEKDEMVRILKFYDSLELL